MTVREYIGARYVPLFVGEWDIDNSYEPLSIVTYEGDSYTSRQYVPVGISITNEIYWAPTGSYNSQIEQYRQEVHNLAESLPSTDFDSVNTVKAAIDAAAQSASAAEAVLPISEFDSVNTVKAAINTASQNANAAIQVVNNKLKALRSAYSHFVVIGDSFSKVGHNVTNTTVWWRKLANFLNMTPHCYAENGCGYLQGSTTFSAQLTSAIADSSFSNGDVGYVFIYGSLNDCYKSFTNATYENAVNDVISDAIAAFPNAEIVIAGINTSETMYSRTGFATPGGNTIYHATRTLEGMLQKQASIYQHCRFIPFSRLMVAQTDWFNDHHPTATGNTVIANAFYNAITGNPMEYKAYRSIGINPIHGTGNLVFMWNDSECGWYLPSGTPAKDGSSDSYSLVYPIPYGLENLISVATTYNGPISLAVPKSTPRTNIAWGFLTDTLPSYITPTPEIDSSLYVQSYLVQACYSNQTSAIKSIF